MALRPLHLLVLSTMCFGCAPRAEPKLAAAEPRVVVDLDDSAEKRGDGVGVHRQKGAPTGRKAPTPAGESDDEKRQRDREIARNAGILGVLQSQSEAGPWGKDSGLGKDPLTAKGTLWGGSVGESFGAGGLGLRGTGQGGGGTGEGIGLGKVGVIGRGGGGGSGYGSGVGRLGSSRHRARARVSPQAPRVIGALSKDVIRRIIRRHHNQVRYCYERQLTKDPSLEGRLQVKFTIDKAGRVAQVAVKKSLEPSVDSCVSRVFRRMVFPKPQGGGIVIVSYPIAFNSGSSTPPSSPKAAPVPGSKSPRPAAQGQNPATK